MPSRTGANGDDISQLQNEIYGLGIEPVNPSDILGNLPNTDYNKPAGFYKPPNVSSWALSENDVNKVYATLLDQKNKVLQNKANEVTIPQVATSPSLTSTEVGTLNNLLQQGRLEGLAPLQAPQQQNYFTVTPDASTQTQSQAQVTQANQAQVNAQAAQDLADSFAYQESLRYNGQTPQQYYQQFQQKPSTQFMNNPVFSVEDAYIQNALGSTASNLTDNELAIARLNVRKQLETEKQINQSANQEQMQRFNLGQFSAMQNPALRYNDTRNSGQKAYYDLVNQLQVNQNISDADVQRRKELLAAQDIGLQGILGASNNANTREANLLTSAQNTDSQFRSGLVQQQINNQVGRQAIADQISAEGRQSKSLITPAERIAILEDLIKDVSISEEDRAVYKQMLLEYKKQLVTL